MGNRSKRETAPKGGAPSTSDGAPGEVNGKFSLISDEKLLALYKNLLKCRKVGRRAGKSNGSSRASRDREAAVVASAIDLGAGDVVCSREHEWFRGISDKAPIEKLLLGSGPHQPGAARRMKPTRGASGGSGPSITQTAIGTALGYKTAKNGKIALLFCAEESPEDLLEAIEIASMHKLPMVFVRHSNGKLNGHVISPRTTKNSSRGDIPYFPSITVDSHDVVAVYRVASEAMSRACQGRGPTLIECRPYRVEGANGLSSTPGHAHDAIVNMEHYLRARGLFERV